MGDYNLGSVAADVVELVPDSVTLSGLPLQKIAYRQVIFMEQYTGESIGSVAIGERYQSALIDLTCADALKSLESESAATESVSLGEFSVKSSSSATSNSSSDMYKTDGMRKLQELGRQVKFRRVI